MKTNVLSKVKNKECFTWIAGIFIRCCCISCEETVQERLEILIQNKTDNPIYIRLYPNEKYIKPLDGFVAA